jgi:hypothetical protein
MKIHSLMEDWRCPRGRYLLLMLVLVQCPGSAWYAEVMRQMGIAQPQQCMAFDPKWAWLYHFGQPNLSGAHAMNAAYSFYSQGGCACHPQYGYALCGC